MLIYYSMVICVLLLCRFGSFPLQLWFAAWIWWSGMTFPSSVLCFLISWSTFWKENIFKFIFYNWARHESSSANSFWFKTGFLFLPCTPFSVLFFSILMTVASCNCNGIFIWNFDMNIKLQEVLKQTMLQELIQLDSLMLLG